MSGPSWRTDSGAVEARLSMRLQEKRERADPAHRLKTPTKRGKEATAVHPQAVTPVRSHPREERVEKRVREAQREF